MPEDGQAAADFLFGGYSWVKKKFELWKISFHERRRRFEATPPPNLMAVPRLPKVFVGRRERGEALNLGTIAIGGDQAQNAEARLVALITGRLARRDDTPARFALNMEPFEVVRDMLGEQPHAHSIGGAPQIVKVYQYSQAGPLAVYWPRREGGDVYLRGRRRLSYENFDSWIFDPDDLRSYHPKYRPYDHTAESGSDTEVAASIFE